MSSDRRSFLVGLGTIITTSFIRDARTCWERTDQPLLLTPDRPTGDLHYIRTDDHWTLHLGTPAYEAPEAPLWIDYIKAKGHKTAAAIKAYADRISLQKEELFQKLDGYGWEGEWEHVHSPAARAYQLLEDHDLFPQHGGYEREGRVVFHDSPNPCSNARWVEIYDPLSLSLLQARLNELNLRVALKPFDANLVGVAA